ncbi:hypothetical protein HYQ46_005284 [Verticillium longisporum]|nr:hypothetical protein HYQ46_005284 [Verticillium longisporum]
MLASLSEGLRPKKEGAQPILRTRFVGVRGSSCLFRAGVCDNDIVLASVFARGVSQATSAAADIVSRGACRMITAGGVAKVSLPLHEPVNIGGANETENLPLLTNNKEMTATTETYSSYHLPPNRQHEDNCFHPSSCSAFWSGKCQDYCDTRGFSHMTGDGCGGLRKKTRLES